MNYKIRPDDKFIFIDIDPDESYTLPKKNIYAVSKCLNDITIYMKGGFKINIYLNDEDTIANIYLDIIAEL